jgi:segregation and condensation protein A
MYRVRLDQFEGPLDLLLFFIQRDELDIYDIPIAQIADEFLEYVRVLEEIDLDGVGDFLYMAAVLINIKARMLLPSTVVDEDGEPIDPRTELVERLLEYVRFKEAAAGLSERFDQRSDLFTRGEASGESAFKVDAPPIVEDASIFDLISALRRVLTEAEDQLEHEIEAEVYSIDIQRDYIREQLQADERVSFVDIVSRRSKPFIVTTFLAVLEMARLGEIVLSLVGGADDFYIERGMAV